MPKIHPTALVDPSARIADDAEIGPFCVIDGDVEIGAGCVLANHVTVRRYTTLGRNNRVDPGCVLGGFPQDLKFDPATVSHLRIGDDNVFREGVTISRATGEGNVTLVGNKTYWMALSHAGHNAVVEDEVILVNGSAIGGHAKVCRRAILSANVVIHQFCWVGELVMMQGNSATSTHVPPYVLVVKINRVAGLNSVGLRRAPYIREEDRRQIKEAYRLLYRSGLTPSRAMERMDACTDWGPAADKFRQFIRQVLQAPPPYNRPLSASQAREEDDEPLL